MSQFKTLPQFTVSATNPSVGPNGTTAPTSSTEVAGINPSGDLQPLQTDAQGNLLVAVQSSPTPQDVNLTEVGGAAISEGQKTMANSLPVAIASDQSTLPVSAASLPLPTGASTAALQSNVQSAPGTPQTVALTVQGNASGVALPISASALPLPTGAATAANQTNASQKSQIVDGSGNVIGSTSNALDVNIKSSGVTEQNVNLNQVGGAAIALGQTTMSASLPVAIASNQSAITVAQATASSLNATVIQGTPANLQAQVSQPTAANLNATVVQGTAANLLAQVSQPTASSLNATVVGLGTAGSPSGGVVSIQGVSSGTAVTVSQDTASNLKTQAFAGTPTAGTVTQAAVSVGTSAVRATVSGSAPSATRSVLVVTPDPTSTATFYIGSSSVTNSGATRGVAIVAGQSFIANSDAGDYYIIASVTSQTVLIMEQA